MSSLRECRFDHRIRTTEDVIQASKVVLRADNFPFRIVIREVQKPERVEFVVHQELLKMDLDPERNHLTIALVHEGFQQGSYCSKYDRAVELYNERVGKL